MSDLNLNKPYVRLMAREPQGIPYSYKDLVRPVSLNEEQADSLVSNTSIINNIASSGSFAFSGFTDGTAALPGAYWTSDTDTGLYRIGANNIGASTGGTLRFDWNNSRIQFIAGYPIYLGATSSVFTNEVLAGYSTTAQVCTRLESTVATAVATYTARNDLGNHIECGVLNSTHVSTSTPAPGGCAYFGYTRVGGLGSNPKGLWIYNDHNEDINFATNQSLRMVLYRSGALCIGASAPVSTEAIRVVGNVLLDSYTAGTIPYFGAGGLMSHNDTELLWDNGNHLFRGANVTMGQYPSISTIAHIKNSNWASGKYGLVMADAGYTILNALNGQLLYLGINDHYYAQCVAGLWGFGEGNTSPSALVDVLQPTLNSEVFRIGSVATNDDPIDKFFNGRVATTDATLTTINTIAIPATTTIILHAKVRARRTGGASGTAEDSAAYVLYATYKNVAGTATLVGSVNTIHSSKDQPGWDCTFNASAGNVLLQVTGAAANNVSWHSTVVIAPIGS